MSRVIPPLFATLTEDVVPNPFSQEKKRPGSYRSNIRLEIASTIRRAVFWRNSLGMLVMEPASTDFHEEEAFFITVHYEFDINVKIDAGALLDEVGSPAIEQERKRIHQQIEQLSAPRPGFSRREFKYTLRVGRAEIEKAGGVAYLNDLDLLVGFQEYGHALPHPYSRAGKLDRVNESFAETQPGICQRYLLIDNSGHIGPRWINTGYDVYELIPQQDMQLDDGIYVTVRHGRNLEPKTLFYSFPEAEKALGLYVARSEAEAFGDPESRFKADLREQEQAFQREKLDFQRAKATFDQEKEEKRQEYETRKHRQEMEKAEFKEEMQRQRDAMTLERDRFQFDREYLQDKTRFTREQFRDEQKHRSEVLKIVLDIGKALLGVLSLAFSVMAVVKKA